MNAPATWPGALRKMAALATVAALPGCASIPSLPQAPLAPAPGSGMVSNLEPYHIQIGDVLAVRLMLNPELNEDVVVRPDGDISTTVVRQQRAYGLTVPQLDSALTHDYSAQLQKPIVNVVVRSVAPFHIYVGGEVANPGEFISSGPPPTLAQAIVRAGGIRLSGNSHAVFIIRRGPNNVPEFLATHFDDLQHGQDPQADVELAPYDVVYVPKTGIAEVYRYFNQYVQQFVPVSWGFSYLVGGGGGGGGTTNVVQAPVVR